MMLSLEAKDELAVELCNTSVRLHELKLADGVEVLIQAVARFIVAAHPSESTPDMSLQSSASRCRSWLTFLLRKASKWAPSRTRFTRHCDRARGRCCRRRRAIEGWWC
jgi:hypothetical protein